MNLWQPTGLSVARVWVLNFVNHVEAILEDAPTPILLETSFSGIQVPKRRCGVGGVGVGIDVIRE